ncbi:MAG: hypothetical protein CVT98_02085, partial [Bacteroidetes bacterium HGW-Bacteroidetes-15]
ETEADQYGLIFAAMAGYNPQEAIPFWQRMSEAGGDKPPEFLSTHPSDATRMKKLKKFRCHVWLWHEQSRDQQQWLGLFRFELLVANQYIQLLFHRACTMHLQLCYRLWY